jgi:tryptophan-rich sensory protein
MSTSPRLWVGATTSNLWSDLFFGLARARAAAAAVAAQWLVTLAALIVFWNIWILPGVLLVPVLLWTGYPAIRSFVWWRHGRQFVRLQAQPAAPPTRLAA